MQTYLPPALYDNLFFLLSHLSFVIFHLFVSSIDRLEFAHLDVPCTTADSLACQSVSHSHCHVGLGWCVCNHGYRTQLNATCTRALPDNCKSEVDQYLSNAHTTTLLLVLILLLLLSIDSSRRHSGVVALPAHPGGLCHHVHLPVPGAASLQPVRHSILFC